MIRILIGVATGKTAREADFYDYFHALQLPIGTLSSFAHGPSIAQNRNFLVAQALNTGCSHILFLDDDVQPQPDAIIKLVCHNVDMVTALLLKRDYPHQSLVFDKILEDGAVEYHYLNDSSKGLVKISASGLGCCLMKCKVFSKLEEPFFRLGEVRKDDISEDIGFFKRIQDIGLNLHCDFDVEVGHKTTTTVWPRITENGWVTSYEYEAGKVAFPAIQRPK